MASNDRKDQLRLVCPQELLLRWFAFVVLNADFYLAPGPLAIAYCLFKLADLRDAAWTSAERGFFCRQPVRCDWEQPGQSVIVPPARF